MRIAKLLSKFQNITRKVPHKPWIIGGVLTLLVLVPGVIFFIPKSIAFSYAGESCVRQLTLFPEAQAVYSDRFEVTIEEGLKIGSFSYAATKVCVAPKKAPQSGSHNLSIGLFGDWFMAKRFSVQVADPPIARKSDVVDRTISTVLPLKVGLTTTDTIHTYELALADKIADCESGDGGLVCDVSTLGLKPGTEYDTSLYRSFKGAGKKKLIEGTVETHRPISIIKNDVTDKKVFYNVPKEFKVTFDKPIESADFALNRLDDGKKQLIATETQIKEGALHILLKSDLPRESSFILSLNQAIAEDGSSLSSPVAINFSTSGGPKPRAVSVGTSLVGQRAQIIVTLDQPIRDTVDIAKFARVEGVPGSVTKQSSTKLIYTLNGAGLCQPFRLVLDKGVQSGSNNEVSKAWKFDSRVICGTTSVIGQSVRGRPIVAYYFGSGTKTILFTGGMHGSEPSGEATMQAWVNYLQANAYRIPSDKKVVIVPNTNPDGIASGSRNNARNVNIGRNFPTANWKANIETSSGVLKNGGGTSAGSEPESAALIALTRQLRPRLEVSFHAQGSLVGANKYGDSVAIGGVYATTVGYQTMFYNAEEVMGYPMTGEYEDWMGEEMGIPAILIELPTPYGSYIDSQISALMKMLSV